MYDHTITENPQLRQIDGKMFMSPHGKLHNGKKCRKLRHLCKDDLEYPNFWDSQIAQTVVELEDGTTAVVLHDEVKV